MAVCMKPFQVESRMIVVGHRGSGKNEVGGVTSRKHAIRENTIASFKHAGSCGVDFVEFDVQVTKDGHPIIFHDDLVRTGEKEAAIGDLTVQEFLAIGSLDDDGIQKRLYRKAEDGSLGLWTVTVEDSFCTLKEAFEEVQPSVGFNIEVKFRCDMNEVPEVELRRVIGPILQDVKKYANGRNIYYSTFHPDAVSILRNEQAAYPVFFLTEGGAVSHVDSRRNSIEAAIQLCKQSKLQGIVSDVRAILKTPSSAIAVKEAGLLLLTYGELNNTVGALQQQASCGVDGVIVDHVSELITAIHNLNLN